MELEGLPDGWTVWDHAPEDRLILAYRPDVFDGSTLSPACMPTIYVREGEQDLRRAGPQPASGTAGTWTVTLILEPEVDRQLSTRDTFEAATMAAVAYARAFDAGALDLESIYQVPREDYLAALAELVGP